MSRVSAGAPVGGAKRGAEREAEGEAEHGAEPVAAPQRRPGSIGPMILVAMVAGFSARARQQRLRRWLKQRPLGQRWLVVADPWALAQFDAAPSDLPSGDRVALAACACCTGSALVPIALNRALRQGWPSRILWDVDARHGLSALIESLRRPPLAQYLTIDAILVLIELHQQAPFDDPEHPAHARARDLLDCAQTVIRLDSSLEAHEGEGLEDFPIVPTSGKTTSE